MKRINTRAVVKNGMEHIKGVAMNDITKVLEEILENIGSLYRYFFNLLEVLSRKGILNPTDIDYIRHHDET